MENKEGLKPVNLQQQTGEIELPKIDVTKYIGKEVQIVAVGTFETVNGLVVRMETEPVETLDRAKGSIILRGSRLFGLNQDDKGKIGWTKASKLGVFLEKNKLKHYNDALGLKVKLQTNTNKNGTDFLTFN